MTIDILKRKVNESDYTKSDLQKWTKALPKYEPLKPVIYEKIKSDDYTKESILPLMNSNEYVDEKSAMIEVQNVISKTKNGVPTKYKKGDTLMHPIFRHPYVLMEQKGDDWVCGLLTSNPDCDEILEKCKSRFFSESHFTKVLFTVSNPIGSFMFPFENTRQVNKVLKDLKSIFQ